MNVLSDIIVNPKYNAHIVGNHFEWTPILKALFDGLLLSDASIHQTSSVAADLRISVSIRNSDWIHKIDSVLQSAGIETDVSSIPAKTSVRTNGLLKGRTIKAGEQICLRTMSYRTLLPERTRWYPNGEKIVPRDVDLSSFSVAQWYMGDGSLMNTHKRFGVKFSTDGFSYRDVSFLNDKMKHLYGTRAAICFMNKTQPYLKFSFSHALKIINLVALHIVPSFRYKIDDLTYDLPRCKVCGEYTGVKQTFYHDACRKFERVATFRAVRHKKLGIIYSRDDVLQSARFARCQALGLPLCVRDPMVRLSRYR